LTSLQCEIEENFFVLNKNVQDNVWLAEETDSLEHKFEASDYDVIIDPIILKESVEMSDSKVIDIFKPLESSTKMEEPWRTKRSQ